MACPRCQVETQGERWCADCERAYDGWSRRYASDIIWPVLIAMVIVTGVAISLPLLGLGTALVGAGVFVGFGTLVGVQRANTRRRRRQFLRGAGVPRAYLPGKT
ncbi:MAG: hypothetical protein H0T89_00175 [Deltaproteobacteria bacterium]|nr:hypothetical protein [Deltaproteobacteria bacterium]MDQ3295328.1 hypothetical protein [Myxococcota bacterium]